jgi:hypothetical protein
MTWVLLIWSALIVIWAGVGASSVDRKVAPEPPKR